MARGLVAILLAAGSVLVPERMLLSHAETQPPARLTLTLVNPSIVTPGRDVTVTGQVIAGAAGLSGIRVEVVRGSATLVTRESVRVWATGARDEVPDGVVLTTTALPDLAGDKSGTFSAKLPASGLRTSRPFAPEPMAVVLRSRGNEPVVLRTFLPIYNRKEFEPLQISWLLAVTLPADPDLFVDDARTRLASWQEAAGSGSRLARLIEAAAGSLVTWIVDSAVLRPVPGVTLGPRADTPAPTPTGTLAPPGAGEATDPVAEVAAQVAAGLTRVSSSRWTLPYADPDLAALTAAIATPGVADELSDLVSGARSAAAATGSGVAPVMVAWPIDGSLREPGRVAALTTAFGTPGPDVSLVTSASVVGRPGFTPTAAQKTPEGQPVIVYDAALSATVTQTTTIGDATLATQRALADSLALLDESAGLPRSFAIAPDRSIDPDPAGLGRLMAALGGAPWVQVRGADDLLGTARAGTADAGVTSGNDTKVSVPSTPLTVPALRSILAGREKIAAVADVLGADAAQAAALAAVWRDRVDQLFSVRWRGRTTWAAANSLVSNTAASVTQGIRVAPASVNFLADQGAVQVTVINDLAVPVRDLRLVLQPQNPRLVILDNPPTVAIGARSKTTVRVEVRAIAAGPVPVSAQLTTSDGTTVGASAQILVRANPPADWWYWAFAGASAVLFVVGLVRNLRRHRRRTPFATTG